MIMGKFRPSTAADFPQIMHVWRSAVDATHDFLSSADRMAIEEELLAFFPTISLQLAVDDRDRPQGFMFLHGGHLEALFIHPDCHGQGIGKAFVAQAVAAHPDLTVDVNEQNIAAMGFYEHLGFEPIGRSELDGQGRAYPLIHLRFRAPS